MKLTKENVKEIKQLIFDGLKQLEIAEKFGVSRSIISDIATNRVHTDVEWPEGYTTVKGKLAITDPEERIRQLESEVANLQSEKSHAVRRAKANAKYAGVFTAMGEELEGKITSMGALPSQVVPKVKACITETAVLHLSDGHHDQVITPASVGGLEDYNFQVSCARAEKLVETVVDWTQGTLAPKFRFPRLVVLAYGDFTSGEIHGACERSYYRNQFKNCLAIGNLHALMYRDLAAHFEAVDVLYLSGNHGRRTPKKDYYGANDNWDYLVAKTAEAYCARLGNVNFTIPDAWSAVLDIEGVGFNVSHGDDSRSNLGIPFYGMVRRQKGLIALSSVSEKLKARYYCIGHHHTASTLSDIDGELMVNGAWLGTDPFAYNALAGYREPAQWLHGVNGKRGKISWRLKCDLRTPEEKFGPKRYKIDGGREIGPIEQWV